MSSQTKACYRNSDDGCEIPFRHYVKYYMSCKTLRHIYCEPIDRARRLSKRQIRGLEVTVACFLCSGRRAPNKNGSSKDCAQSLSNIPFYVTIELLFSHQSPLLQVGMVHPVSQDGGSLLGLIYFGGPEGDHQHGGQSIY